MSFIKSLTPTSTGSVGLSRSRSIWTLCYAVLFIFAVSSCNTGSRNGADGGNGQFVVPGNNTGGPGGSNLTIPIFFSMEPDLVCPGQVVLLRGINFDAELENNVVLFRFGSRSVQGMPLNVAFPSDNSLADGRDSILRVVVPTGVLTGTVEVHVNGFFAGAVGYLACPMVMGYELNVDRQAEALVHQPPLGFDISIGPETVFIHGLNFTELTQVNVQDSSGRSLTLGPASFRRNRIDPDNNVDSISFSLENARFNVTGPRDNISVSVATDNFTSNTVYVPVQPAADLGTPLGPVINGLLLPNGVRTGPVRIMYSMYDRPISMSYLMEFEWSVDNGTTWNLAALDFDDPVADGTQPNLPNIVLPGSQFFPSNNTVLRGGGGAKVFTWDTASDEAFRTLNESLTNNGDPAPRHWAVKFRITAKTSFDDDTDDRAPSTLLYETPPLAYYDLEPRLDSNVDQLRVGHIEETFVDDDNFDDDVSDALWGPPFNSGSLQGALANRPISQFGEGDYDLVLDPIAFEPEFFFSEYFLVDTTRMTISRVAVLDEDEDGQPDVEQATLLFPTIDVENPGQDAGEFHLRSLTVTPGMELRTRGSEPLIFRLSGDPGDDDAIMLSMLGTLNADGGDAAAEAGGAGRLGGGDGGTGALLGIAGLAVTGHVPATDGGLNGGGAGPTPGAVEWNIAGVNAQTRFNGSPGGGGGAREPGGAGDPGEPRPENYPPPKKGRAGPRRGNEYLLPLIPGSGGGGGGATINGAATGPGAIPGGGGGAGGGAIAFYVRGSADFGDTGLISANGGAGASGTGPNDRGGPGGGGSGGCILVRSTGFIESTCDSFSVQGGAAGPSASTLNSPLGSGDGGDGWIRLETKLGGVPFCSFLPDVVATLDADLRRASRTTSISLSSTDSFPSQGTIIIEDEEIQYTAKNDANDQLTGITRAVNGTELAAHTAGVAVRLPSVLSPAESFIGESIQTTPDVIDTKLGLDQALHCIFIPSLDPFTGELLRDRDGNVMSIWTFNTDTGIVTTPEGLPSKAALNRSDNPGQLQLTRLTIDAGVTLRGVGSNPMSLVITEIAEIYGTIDVSGEHGGTLRFNNSADQRAMPLGGEGGAPGPGGGVGGTGGHPIFLNGDITDKTPANLDAQPGQAGGLPAHLPAQFNLSDFILSGAGSQNDLAFMETFSAGGGAARLDNLCEDNPVGNRCTDSAGGGGGGGHLNPGEDGDTIGTNLAGIGGGSLGLNSVRYNGSFLMVGGGGGAGGGPSSALSEDYKNLNTGTAQFRGEAAYAPGTGGGGGGGFLHMAVRGSMTLHAGGQILANGGNAYQSIDLGGNGGAGGGGTIFIQVVNALRIEPGSRIEANGGIANMPVPRTGELNIPVHEGNVRDGSVHGGLGGNGASGRIRIEAPEGNHLLTTGTLNESIYGGAVADAVEPSVGVSTPFRMGIGPGLSVYTHKLKITSQLVNLGEFGLPLGTRANVLWQRANEDLDFYGEVGSFGARGVQVSDLGDGEFIRFQAYFESNNVVRQAPSIRRIRVEFELPSDD